MKKEIVFAVIIGLIVGLIITFGMYRARQAMTGATTVNDQISQNLASPSASPLATATPAQDAFLVSEPSDESLVTDSQVRVSGQAFPNAAIVILTQNGETVGMADDKGNFSIAVTLLPGGNVLTIRALSDTRDPLEVVRTVVLSSADLTASPSAVSTESASPSPTPKSKVKPSPTPKVAQ